MSQNGIGLNEYRETAQETVHSELTNITHRYHEDVFQEHFKHKYRQSLSPVEFRPANTVENIKYGLSLQYNLQSKIDNLDFVTDSREFVSTNKELYRRLKCSQYSYFCSRNPEGIVGDLKYEQKRTALPATKRASSREPSAITPPSVHDVHEEKNRCYTPKEVERLVPIPRKRSLSASEELDVELRAHYMLTVPKNMLLYSHHPVNQERGTKQAKGH